MNTLLEKLKQSKRPLIIAGGGVRLARATSQFRTLVSLLGIPVVVPLQGLDLLSFDNPFYMGHGGTKGQRAANMIIQEADFILVIGSRLCISFIGYNPLQFAPNAYKVVVDIDPVEHKKKTIHIDEFIETDAWQFIKEFIKMIESKTFQPTLYKKWITRCRSLKKKYAIFKGGPMYRAVSRISKFSKEGDVFISDAGITAYVVLQTLQLKKRQRIIFPAATLTMGYNLPAVLGVHAAGAEGDIICITGDGSFQSNLQELQTLVYNKVKAKIFVINNGGYLAIRTTQKNVFQRFIGEGPSSGVSFPSLKKIARAYGIMYVKNNIKRAMKEKGLIICEITTPHFEEHLTVAFGKPNSEMVPAP